MSTQLDTTQRKIVALSKLQRGHRTRKDIFGDEDRIGFNTYANFEAGESWPRSRNMRVIEEILGWKPGIIDEVMASEMPAGDLTLAHMNGVQPLRGGASIRDFSDAEYFADLPRRINRVEDLLERLNQFTLAASDDLGGIEPDQIEDA